jgi:hypothetical protein
MIPESPSIVNKHSPSSICGALRSRTKTALVWLLGWLLVWRPRLAILLGRLIERLLPRLKEASR